MRQALAELEVDGTPTTREFHLRLLDHPAWAEGIATTPFLERYPEVIPPPAPQPPADAAAASPETIEVVAEVDGRRFTVRLHGGNWEAGGTSAFPSAVRRPEGTRPPAYRAAARAQAADGALLRSPIQGTVVRVAVQPGETVRRGQTVCVVEAMKMENDVAAHRDGVLRELLTAPGAAVRVGDPLAEID
jgi:acetyl-CoA/propionyl-CoA carboxylase biotin carboxyl carrier protein